MKLSSYVSAPRFEHGSVHTPAALSVAFRWSFTCCSSALLASFHWHSCRLCCKPALVRHSFIITEPAWHRNARQQRARARQRLHRANFVRINSLDEAAASLLENHHGSSPPSMGRNGRWGEKWHQQRWQRQQQDDEWTEVQRKRKPKGKGRYIVCMSYTGNKRCSGYAYCSNMAVSEIECNVCGKLYPREYLSDNQRIYYDQRVKSIPASVHVPAPAEPPLPPEPCIDKLALENELAFIEETLAEAVAAHPDLKEGPFVIKKRERAEAIRKTLSESAHARPPPPAPSPGEANRELTKSWTASKKNLSVKRLVLTPSKQVFSNVAAKSTSWKPTKSLQLKSKQGSRRRLRRLSVSFLQPISTSPMWSTSRTTTLWTRMASIRHRLLKPKRWSPPKLHVSKRPAWKSIPPQKPRCSTLSWCSPGRRSGTLTPVAQATTLSRKVKPTLAQHLQQQPLPRPRPKQQPKPSRSSSVWFRTVGALYALFLCVCAPSLARRRKASRLKPPVLEHSLTATCTPLLTKGLKRRLRGCPPKPMLCMLVGGPGYYDVS